MASPSIPPCYPTQGPLQAGPLAPLLLPSPPPLGSPQSLLSSDAVASAALPPRSPLAVLLCPHSSSLVLVALLGSCHIGRRSFSLLWDFVFPELKSMVLSMPFDLPIKGTHCPPQSGTSDLSGVEHSSQFQESVVSLGRGMAQELGAPFWVGSRFYLNPPRLCQPVAVSGVVVHTWQESPTHTLPSLWSPSLKAPMAACLHY